MFKPDRGAIASVLALVLPSLAAQAQVAEPSVPAAVPQALVSVINDYAAAFQDRSSSMIVRSAGHQMAPGDGDWSALEWVQKEDTLTWRLEWSALLERRALVAAPIDAPASARSQIVVWTGTECFSRQTNARGTQWVFSPQPILDPQWDFVSLFNGGLSWPSFAGPQALADLVQSFTFLRQEMHGEITRYVFAWSGKPSAPQLALSVRQDGPQARLASVEMRTFTPPSDPRPGALFIRKTLELDWRDVDSNGLPKRATYMQGRTDGASTEIEVHALLIERSQSSVPQGGADSEEKFQPPPFQKGDAVVDRCYGLSYVIGETSLLMNSVQVDVKAPIDHRITTDLKELAGEIAGVKDGKATTSDKS